MNCSEHQDWLQTWLDGAPVDKHAEAQEHRALCAGCRELFHAAQRLLAVLGRTASLALPEGFADRIVAAVQAERRRGVRFFRAVTVGALAASLLLAVFLGLRYWRPAPEIIPGVVENRHPAPVEPSLKENIEEATAAVVELTRRTTDETVGQTRLLLPALVPDTPMPDGLALVALNSPVEPLREIQESVSEGLEPVTTSWRRALDLFRRNIPPMTPSE